MKKILIFASILCLSSCSLNAGGKPFWPTLVGVGPSEETYNIDFFEDEGLKLVKTEEFNEIEPKSGAVHRVYTGHSVFYDKAYKKYYYQDCFVKANVSGALESLIISSKINKSETKKLLGRSEVDGTWYSLLPANKKSYVWLIKEDGKIADMMGQIKDNELYILDTSFNAEPNNLSFKIIKETKMEQTMPTTGFEIKYNGLKDGNISFLVLDYSEYGKNKGDFENLIRRYTPNQNLEIKNVLIKVLHADEEKIDYIILGYN